MSDQQMDQEKSYVADNEIVYRMISSPLGYNEVTGVSHVSPVQPSRQETTFFSRFVPF